MSPDDAADAGSERPDARLDETQPHVIEEDTQPYSIEEATQPYSIEEATQPYSFDAAVPGAPGAPQPMGLPDPVDEGPRTPASPIDSLFAASAFAEYDNSVLPAPALTPIATPRPRLAAHPLTPTQRTLLIVAGGLVALVVLVGIFVVGTRFPDLIPSQDAAPAPTKTVAPVAAAPVVGPIGEGEHEWSDLLGTECLDPFDSAWEQQYTVVDCAAPHAAQLVYRGIFADEAYAPYPGIDVLQARINLLCTAPTSVNYAAAGALDDIAVSASYAATAESWDAGDRSYYCFLSRLGGDPITGSLANAPVADAGPVPSIPSLDP